MDSDARVDEVQESLSEWRVLLNKFRDIHHEYQSYLKRPRTETKECSHKFENEVFSWLQEAKKYMADLTVSAEDSISETGSRDSRKAPSRPA